MKICLIVVFIGSCFASHGDTSNEYRGCYHLCHFNNCTSGKSIQVFHSKQGVFERALKWSCEDDCQYNCMWHTTEVYIRRKWDVPQFYGKWPFIRMFGLQEPASVIFSLVNLFANIHNILLFRKQVPSTAPLYLLWHIYSMICVNAWIWSIVFHARDTSFSEAMDYFSAFSMVLFSLLALVIRMLGKKKNLLQQLILLCTFLGFFLYHVWYLNFRSFDYGYNMKVNILVGLINGFGWLLWSWTRKNQRAHLVWCQITVVGFAGSMLFEMLDFAPILWTFDAHAIWHLSTSPLPYYWYKFLIGDCLYLMDKDNVFSKLKKSA